MPGESLGVDELLGFGEDVVFFVVVGEGDGDGDFVELGDGFGSCVAMSVGLGAGFVGPGTEVTSCAARRRVALRTTSAPAGCAVMSSDCSIRISSATSAALPGLPGVDRMSAAICRCSALAAWITCDALAWLSTTLTRRWKLLVTGDVGDAVTAATPGRLELLS